MTAWAGDYAKYYEGLPTPVKAVEPIVIPANEVNLKEVGGIGDGVTLCTEAFEKGISKLSKAGGGRLTVPEGVWLTGHRTASGKECTRGVLARQVALPGQESKREPSVSMHPRLETYEYRHHWPRHT